jgi:hypothetical protein
MVQNHCQIKPALAGPDIADINHPLLIGPICREVLLQQIGRDVKLVIAVRGDLEFMGSDDRYSVLAHQSSDAAVANFQTNLLQLFRHPRPTITVQAQAVLYSDMGQQNHVFSLTWTDRAGTIGAIPTRTDIHDLTQPFGWK